MFETTVRLTDSELIAYLSELARIEAEASYDNDALEYGSR
jgi:hypothetical protein